MTHSEIAVALRAWIHEPAHYSVVHFAVEIGIDKGKLFKMATEDEELQSALDYAMSVQEFKIVEGALSGALEKTVALKLLATYAGWEDKSEINLKGAGLAADVFGIITELQRDFQKNRLSSMVMDSTNGIDER